MNWLFVHQNFPAQFAHVARHLAAGGDQVVFITQQREREIGGVRKIVYAPPRPAAGGVHPFVHEFNAAIENGLAVARVCEELKHNGFTPDLVAGHNGWGEILYVKECWPSVPLLMRLRTRNAVNLLGLETADWGQTPTEFQRSRYPERYRRAMSVIHEGIVGGVMQGVGGAMREP